MPTPEISDGGRPVTIDDIAALEARFGCKLPAPYVRFLEQHNGGHPEPDAFRGERPEDDALAHFFFAVDGNEHTDLLQNAAFFREYHDVPGHLLPIARTTSGDIVCIGIGEGSHGEVHFWSHDHPVREKATWKLADDFDSFLASFYEVDIFHEPTPRSSEPAPTGSRPRTLDESRADMERGASILRRLEESEAEEDRVVDALLAEASSAEAVIQTRGGADAHGEVLVALRRLAERTAWQRSRRAPSPTFGPITDSQAFEAQDDALMRAITDHHIRENGAAARVVEALDALARGRRVLLSLGEKKDGPRIASLDAAFNRAREWLAQSDASKGSAR